MLQSSSGLKSRRLKHSVEMLVNFPISKLPSENSIFPALLQFSSGSSITVYSSFNIIMNLYPSKIFLLLLWTLQQLHSRQWLLRIVVTINNK